MKKLLFGTMLLLSMSAFAMQLPMQQSSNIAKQLIGAISSDSGMQFLSISKISIGDGIAKVELLDNKGDCSAYPFKIITDGLGQTSVKLMTDALAQCD